MSKQTIILVPKGLIKGAITGEDILIISPDLLILALGAMYAVVKQQTHAPVFDQPFAVINFLGYPEVKQALSEMYKAVIVVGVHNDYKVLIKAFGDAVGLLINEDDYYG